MSEVFHDKLSRDSGCSKCGGARETKHYYCNSCRAKYNRDWRAARPGKLIELRNERDRLAQQLYSLTHTDTVRG